jgi:hypothetical protein
LSLSFADKRKWLRQFCDLETISLEISNPFAVVKVLEKRNLQESNILKSLRAIPITLKSGSEFNPKLYQPIEN